MLQDQEVRGAEFQQLAYHRILIMLFLELNAPEQVLDSINFQVGSLKSIGKMFLIRGHAHNHYSLIGVDGVLSDTAHFEASQSFRIRIRLVGDSLSPRVHRSLAFYNTTAEGLGNVRPTLDRSFQVFGSFPAQC